MGNGAGHCVSGPDSRSPALSLARVAPSLLLLVLLASSAVAQPIRIHAPATQSATGSAHVAPQDPFSITRVTLALGAVVSLVLFFRWGARRFMPGGVTSGHSRAVQVISRTIVSPKQQLMLVKVSRPLVLVANSAAGINAICEIRDVQEVADVALMLPFVQPAAYGLGKSGWVAADFSAHAPDVDMLKAWIDESYRAQAPKKLVATLDGAVQATGPRASGLGLRPGTRKPAAKAAAKRATKDASKPATPTPRGTKPATAKPRKPRRT